LVRGIRPVRRSAVRVRRLDRPHARSWRRRRADGRSRRRGLLRDHRGPAVIGELTAEAPSGFRALWLRLRRADLPVVVLGALLIVAGFAAIASAGGDRGPLLLLRQAEACALGVVVLLVIVLVPYQRLLRLAPPVYAVLLVMLGLVLVIGPVINGARRWL